MGLVLRKPDSVHVNNKWTDRHVHSHSLISTFVIYFLESIKAKLATGL